MVEGKSEDNGETFPYSYKLPAPSFILRLRLFHMFICFAVIYDNGVITMLLSCSVKTDTYLVLMDCHFLLSADWKRRLIVNYIFNIWQILSKKEDYISSRV